MADCISLATNKPNAQNNCMNLIILCRRPCTN